MLTGKQKRYLRSQGNTLEPIFQVGKGGVNDNLVKQVDDALGARELVKLHMLKQCPDDVRQVAAHLSQSNGAEVVQVIGHNFILYRASDDHLIELPK
jgi:RNA-binding protein